MRTKTTSVPHKLFQPCSSALTRSLVIGGLYAMSAVGAVSTRHVKGPRKRRTDKDGPFRQAQRAFVLRLARSPLVPPRKDRLGHVVHLSLIHI